MSKFCSTGLSGESLVIALDPKLIRSEQDHIAGDVSGVPI